MKKAKKTKTIKKAVKTVKKSMAKKAPAKKTKKVAKPVVKKAPKPIQRVADQETIMAEAVTDETGVVMMRSVDDQGESDENEGVVMKPVLDNGVLTLVPEKD